jgi:hypothetical protein
MSLISLLLVVIPNKVRVSGIFSRILGLVLLIAGVDRNSPLFSGFFPQNGKIHCLAYIVFYPVIAINPAIGLFSTFYCKAIRVSSLLKSMH